MTSLQNAPSAPDRLPPDQQAVLQMVLVRGKSYDEIARLLSIDRTGVRQRALAAFDALGPTTRLPAERRALITDYLLGQLPPRVSDEVHKNLAGSATERAWARVVASELAPLSREPLPEIPVATVEPERSRERERDRTRRTRAADADGAGEAEETEAPAAAAEDDEESPRASEAAALEPDPGRTRVSRLGGAILLGGIAAVVIAAVVVFVVIGVGGGSGHKASSAKHGLTTKTNSAQPLAQINLTPPSGGKAVGIAEVIKAGSHTGVVVVASGLAANTKHNAYAVWLSNSSSSFLKLGYVQQAVTSNGRLQTAGSLPSTAGNYKQLLVTLQTGPSNRPGRIVLEGSLSGL